MRLFESKTAHLLREVQFNCILPDLLTLSPEHIRVWGIHTTGHEETDRAMRNRRVHVSIPIELILEYYLKGIDIEFPDKDQLLLIHKYINDYLDEWKEHMQYDINLRVNEYSENLRNLESLNKEIYNFLSSAQLIKQEKSILEQIGIVSFSSQVSSTSADSYIPYSERYDSISNTLRDKIKRER